MLEILKSENHYIRAHEKWLNDSYIDDEDRMTLLEMTNAEMRENFSSELVFGTGGIRERMGLGTNCINKYTIRKITQAVCNYMKKAFLKEGRYVAVISYDTRQKSKAFAIEAARVFMANGIYVYLFDNETPTPVLAYFTKELNANLGIMITASHNSKEYNGYKVYNGFGMQLTNENTEMIQREMKKIDSFKKIRFLSFYQFSRLDQKNMSILENEVYEDYIKRIKEEIVNKEVLTSFYEEKQNLRIVYSPLNGTGCTLSQRIFEELGIIHVFIPEVQKQKDPHFTTVPKPNPEELESFRVSLELAEKEDADVIFLNDPDADRLGVMYKDKNSRYRLLSGNTVGVLLLSYILKTKKEKLIEEFVAKTIVTTNIVERICKDYGIEVKNTHTGFKNIGKQIVKEPENFIFGLEESNGYLKGSYIADKDGIASMMLFVEFLLGLERDQMHLEDYIRALYETYSYFDDLLITKSYPTLEEIGKIDEIMSDLRQKPFYEIANLKISRYIDYSKGEGDFYANVLYYELEDGSFICVRPSGTEPKIKVYVNLLGESEKELEAKKTLFANFIRKNVLKDLNF